MRWLLLLLLCPFVAVCRFGLEVLFWFRPDLARGRRPFPDSIKQLIARATAVQVHYAELNLETPGAEAQPGATMGWRSLGMVRVESWWLRRWLIRAVLKANRESRESLGGLLCLDAEYGLRFQSELGCADLMICFQCSQVWVSAQVQGGQQYYPISCRPQPLLDWLLQSGLARPIPRSVSNAGPDATMDGPPEVNRTVPTHVAKL
jgi:hypothetical protein